MRSHGACNGFAPRVKRKPCTRPSMRICWSHRETPKAAAIPPLRVPPHRVHSSPNCESASCSRVDTTSRGHARSIDDFRKVFLCRSASPQGHPARRFRGSGLRKVNGQLAGEVIGREKAVSLDVTRLINRGRTESQSQAAIRLGRSSSVASLSLMAISPRCTGLFPMPPGPARWAKAVSSPPRLSARAGWMPRQSESLRPQTCFRRLQ